MQTAAATASEAADDRIPSLVAVTIRRSISAGKIYLIMSTGLTALFGAVLLQIPKGGDAILSLVPLQAPLYLGLGATGALMVFSSDRSKGVLEYLIAYGVSPRTLFWNGAAAAAGLTAICLSLALPLLLAIAVVSGGHITTDTLQLLVLYTVPMTIAGAVFTQMCGMLWAALSTPRAGINSPVGVAPLIGIFPQILVLVFALSRNPTQVPLIGATAAGLMFAAVGLMTVLSGKLVVRERFLSPL